MIVRFIIAFVLVALIAGGLVGYNMFRDRMIEQYFANMPTPTLTVSTTIVEPIEWKPSIAAIGTVSAANGVDLAVETSGLVEEITFAPNGRVKQGDVLVRLDDEMQKADLAAAQTQAALDQQTLERARELQRRGVGTTSDLESAEAAASASAAQVMKAGAALSQKQLRAPFNGTIGIPQVELGQYLTPGTIVATLQDLERMRVNFTVPEQELQALKIGQPVRAGLTDSDMPFTGAIIGIDPKVNPSTRLVSVRAEIANPEGRLNPGQFVRVMIELPAEQDVLAVPQTAVVTSLYGDYVYRLRPQGEGANPAPAEAAAPSAGPQEEPDASQSGAEPATPKLAQRSEPAAEKQPGSAAAKAAAQPGAAPKVYVIEQVFVEVGRRSEGSVEIKRGLSAGDLVVNAGQNRLTNGAQVTIDNTVQPLQVGSTVP